MIVFFRCQRYCVDLNLATTYFSDFFLYKLQKPAPLYSFLYESMMIKINNNIIIQLFVFYDIMTVLSTLTVVTAKQSNIV